MAQTAQRGDRKAIWAWSLYDFANSSFTTLVVTFIYGTYFTGYMTLAPAAAANEADSINSFG